MVTEKATPATVIMEDAIADLPHTASVRREYARMRRDVTVGQFLDIAEESAWSVNTTGSHLERALRVVSLKSARYSIEQPLVLGAAIAGADDGARGQFAELEVGPGRDVGGAVAARVGQRREAAQLVGGDLARRDAQAHHETVLRRGDVEEAVELEAERVGLVGELAGRGVGDEFLPDIEAVLLVLPAFGLGEIGEERAENVLLRPFDSAPGRRGEVAGDGGAR